MVNILDILDKDKIRNDLRAGLCRVIFTKSSGDERIMYCTLSETLIPKVEVSSESKRTKKENPDIQAVYDVKASGWRSFRWDAVKEFTSEVTE